MERGTVTLPRLGTIKTHESTRKLARRIEAGTSRILSATVSRTAQRWHVSFTVEAGRDIPAHHPRPGSPEAASVFGGLRKYDGHGGSVPRSIARLR